MPNSWDGGSILVESDRQLVRTARRTMGNAAAVPTSDLAEARAAALNAAERALIDVAVVEFRHSPLGPEWSSDIDIHVTQMPPRGLLLAHGWLDLSALLERLGRDGDGRWAIVSDGAVVGAADFTTAEAPTPIDATIARIGRTPSLRSVLELRVLQRSGVPIPMSPRVLAVAHLERELGGLDLEIPASAPNEPTRTWTSRDTTAVLSKAKDSIGSLTSGTSRCSVAVSGVDGAGKSSVIGQLTAEMERAGVPVTRIWARPGFDLGVLGRVGSSIKSALGHQKEPGTRVIGSGDALPSSRTGRVAQLWKALIIAKYLSRVRRRHATADGIALFDRHGIDAAVTLSVLYGADPQRWHRRFQKLLPTPAVHVYLEIDAGVAAARKTDDPMGPSAISAQLDLYNQLLERSEGISCIDGSAPVNDTVSAIWRALVESSCSSSDVTTAMTDAAERPM